MSLSSFLNKFTGADTGNAVPGDKIEEKSPISWDELGNFKPEKTEMPTVPERLERLERDGFIDTENPETVQKYKNNLNFLATEIKKSGHQDNFMLIRDDNDFPYGYKWDLSSATTQTKIIKNPLTVAIRREIARNNHPEIQRRNINTNFMIPGLNDNSEQIRAEADRLDPTVGAIYGPAHFRSTKHFTINTALGHTGSYNSVESGRNFTVIDTIDYFMNSPYRYSLAYEDAYVDVTHEQLEISQKAAILISIERYNDIKNDQKLMSEISKRKLVLYSGDESTAINMFLSEQGIFPNNVGMFYHDYDPKLEDILENSIEDLATRTGTPYNLGHGNIDGAGGHFTSFFDDQNRDYDNWRQNFLATLSRKFPDSRYVFHVMSDYDAAEHFIAEVGLEKVKLAIEEINQDYLEKTKLERERYYEERRNLSSEDKQLMRDTVQRISSYFKGTKNYIASSSDIYGLIQAFYQSKNIQEQIEAAKQINQLLDKDLA